ncbi:MAG: adenylate/guanylate cyclase domain-containing protein [Hyphomicrobiaceae bacterium]
MHILIAGNLLQRLRLVSGLILFAFALTHFLNHAVGLFGLDTMEVVHEWRTTVTRSWLGGAILIGALVVHVSLALLRVARRSTLMMPLWEVVQIASGLLIPLLLIPHVIATRVAYTFYDVNDNYLYELAQLWPGMAIEQSLLLVIVWTHGCIGLHFWLRLWPGYRPLQPLALVVAVAVPLLGLAGFISAGREVADFLLEPGEIDTFKEEVQFPESGTVAWLAEIAVALRWAFAGLVATAFALIGLRTFLIYLGPRIGITYLAGPKVRSVLGPTLLEISRRKGVPHASVCGGRGRCSTCRVQIGSGAQGLAPATLAERRTLERIGAGPDIRLACQIRPAADMSVTRLVKPGSRRLLGGLLTSVEQHGVERTVAVLFLDIRGFTRMTQGRLPYDVIFVLNRLFEHLGEAIRKEGGWIEKYLGDGLLAVFGRESGGAIGTRQALRAVRAIDLALADANAELASELGQPVEIGLGLHAGPVVLGEIGHPASMTIDVIGETVNAAARLEALTKEERCQAIVSEAVLDLAGVALPGFAAKLVSIRGLDRPLSVTLIPSGQRLPEVPGTPAGPDAARIQPQSADNDTLIRREL